MNCNKTTQNNKSVGANGSVGRETTKRTKQGLTRYSAVHKD